MPAFTKITDKNIVSLRRFFEQQPYRLCDFSIGVTFMWRQYLQTAFLIHEDMLVCRITLPKGIFFTFPIGDGNILSTLDFLKTYCAKQRIPLQFAGVPELAVPILTKQLGEHCVIKNRRDNADYLYTYDTFLNFPGRHLAAKRNLLRRFWKQNPDCAFAPLQPQDIPRAITFIQNFAKTKAKLGILSDLEREECDRSCELIANMETFHLKVGVLQKGDDIIAISAGEIVRDTLIVHIEKADTRYTGIYQAISNAYAQYMKQEGVCYINREDDTGDEGLRKSKLSYRPHALLFKHEVQE